MKPLACRASTTTSNRAAPSRTSLGESGNAVPVPLAHAITARGWKVVPDRDSRRTRDPELTSIACAKMMRALSAKGLAEVVELCCGESPHIHESEISTQSPRHVSDHIPGERGPRHRSPPPPTRPPAADSLRLRRYRGVGSDRSPTTRRAPLRALRTRRPATRASQVCLRPYARDPAFLVVETKTPSLQQEEQPGRGNSRFSRGLRVEQVNSMCQAQRRRGRPIEGGSCLGPEPQRDSRARGGRGHRVDQRLDLLRVDCRRPEPATDSGRSRGGAVRGRPACRHKGRPRRASGR